MSNSSVFNSAALAEACYADFSKLGGNYNNERAPAL